MSNRRHVEVARVTEAHFVPVFSVTTAVNQNVGIVSSPERRCQQFGPASVTLSSPTNNRSRIERKIDASILCF